MKTITTTTQVVDEREMAHGLTESQLSELRLDQISGKQKQSRNSKSGYEFPASEKHLVHVEIHTPQFNTSTGQDEGSKVVQKFYPQEFERMSRESAFAGSKVTVLHDPEGDAQDVNPADHIAPQIMSEPGAGTPLATEGVDGDEWEKMDGAGLKANYEHLIADGNSEKMSRPELIEAIKAKLKFAADETFQKTANNQQSIANDAQAGFDATAQVDEQLKANKKAEGGKK
jgi:hypothetical protein